MCVGSKLKIKKVSPLLFIFNLSAEIKNQAAGKIRCFFDCLLTGESSWRHHYVILRNFLESEFLIYSKRIQAIAVTSYVLTKFCFSSDAGLPDYAKRAPKFRIKVWFIKLSAWNRGQMFPVKSGRSLIHFGSPWAHFRIGCLILIPWIQKVLEGLIFTTGTLHFKHVHFDPWSSTWLQRTFHFDIKNLSGLPQQRPHSF